MLFSQLLRELDQLLTNASDHPSGEQVARFAELVQDTTLRQYAFEHLTEPGWLLPLQARGFFSSPPPPVLDESRKVVSFPFWPESRYLVRMVSRDPATVAEIIHRVPVAGNLAVIDDLADAALAMPPALTASLVPQAKEWAESAGDQTLPASVGKLIVKLARGGEPHAALELAYSLLAVLPDPRSGLQGQQEGAAALPPEPRSHFTLYDYEEIVRESVPPLSQTAGRGAVQLFCALLEEAVNLSRRRRNDEEEDSEDYSYIWRPTIEGGNRESGRGLKDILVSAVRDAGEQTIRSGQVKVSDLAQDLEARHWRVFDRLALHFLLKFPDGAGEVIAQRLTDYNRLFEPGLRYEYRLLLKEHFSRLLDEQRETVLTWMDQGPNLSLFAERYEYLRGQVPTEEEQREFADAWRRDWLACLSGSLPREWQERYDDLVSKLGRSAPAEPAVTRAVFVGPTAPRSSEDLQAMSVEELTEFLRSWQPPPRTAESLDTPTPEGLGRILQTIVGAKPERYGAAAELFRGLDPTYVRSLLMGLREAVAGNHSFDWLPVLSLCRWVVDLPYSPSTEPETWFDRDTGWGWTRGAIADLLYSGFEQQEVECPFELQSAAAAVLEPLTDDPEPTPEYEARYGGSNMDPATLSLNTIRGKAMHALVRYGLWVRRHLNKNTRTSANFDQMPEMRKILDRHLDPAVDPALAVRAVYGQWFPWLVMLDRTWAEGSVARIFPREPGSEELRDAAWSTYLRFCQPYNPVLEVLSGEYAHAIERIGEATAGVALDGSAQRLTEHLLAFYWSGKLGLEEDGMLARFYTVAPGALRGHSLRFAGISLGHTEGEIAPQIISRLQSLWEWRLGIAKASREVGWYAAELAAFGRWFVSNRFNTQWLIANLHESLRLAAEVDPLERVQMEPQDDVVKRLAELASDAPLTVVQCLGYLADSDREGWRISHWRDAGRTILEVAIEGTNVVARNEAIQIADRLVARGFHSFHEVIPANAVESTASS